MESSSKQPQEPPPYEPWMSITEESVTRPAQPPPNFFEDRQEFESRLNASADSAESAQRWVETNPLWPPSSGDQQVYKTPFWWGVEFQGSVEQLTAAPPLVHEQQHKHGLGSLFGRRNNHSENDQQSRTPLTGNSRRQQWVIKTKRGSKDACLVYCWPAYSALRSVADAHERRRPQLVHGQQSQHKPPLQILAYFELAIDTARIHDDEASIAIGLVAMPYPLWRLPGWNRASVGVHGDDGRRFVNDALGGCKFVKPFRAGDIVGLGWRLLPAETVGNRGNVQIFFTRNGKVEGSWDLYEPLDASTEQPGGVLGLEGGHDLHPAVGVCGECKVVFRQQPQDWIWRPEPADFFQEFSPQTSNLF